MVSVSCINQFFWSRQESLHCKLVVNQSLGRTRMRSDIGSCHWTFICRFCGITAEKQTTPPKFNSSPLKIDGWKTIRLPFGWKANFQGRTVNRDVFLFVPIFFQIFRLYRSFKICHGSHLKTLSSFPPGIPFVSFAMAAVAAPEMEDLRAPQVKKRWIEHRSRKISKDGKHMKHGHVTFFDVFL